MKNQQRQHYRCLLFVFVSTYASRPWWRVYAAKRLSTWQLARSTAWLSPTLDRSAKFFFTATLFLLFFVSNWLNTLYKPSTFTLTFFFSYFCCFMGSFSLFPNGGLMNVPFCSMGWGCGHDHSQEGNLWTLVYHRPSVLLKKYTCFIS